MKTRLLIAILLLIFFAGIISCNRPVIIRPPALGPDLLGATSISDWKTFDDLAPDYDPVEGGIRIITDENGNVNYDTEKPLKTYLERDLMVGKAYQFVFRIKADTFPVGQNISFSVKSPADGTQMVQVAYNVSKEKEWETVIVPVIPKKDGPWRVLFAFSHNPIKYTNTPSTIYLDPDVDLFEMPAGYEVANLEPINMRTDKDPFLSSTHRIDEWGNIYIKSVNSNNWNHTFPKMIYKGYNGAYKPEYFEKFERYKEYGFNGVMDVWVENECKDVLRAGLDNISLISPPQPEYYRYLEDVSDWANANDEHEHILWTNFDNEYSNAGNTDYQNHVANRANQLFLDPNTGRRRHPIYYLNGQFGLPRSYHNSQRDVMDISGSYVGSEFLYQEDKFICPGPTILTEFLTQHQRTPVPVIQLQSFYEENFIPSLFYGIILGGKALSVWRDSTYENKIDPEFQHCYWACAFKYQVSERLDKMLPIIALPHITQWRTTTTEFPAVRVGTRMKNREGYLIFANFAEKDMVVHAQVNGLAAKEAVDYFTGEHIADVTNGEFEFEIGHFNDGYRVIKLLGTKFRQ